MGNDSDASATVVQHENITAEVTAEVNSESVILEWEARAQAARNVTISLSVGGRTDLGRVRENNEDKYQVFLLDDEDALARKGCLFAVADGMGGHSAGQIASELALRSLVEHYYGDTSPLLVESLRAGLRKGNALIFDAARIVPDRAGMGTTLTALVIRGREAFVAHVGDSRCYLLRGNKLLLLSEDHSWVAEQVKLGGLTEAQARMSPYRNVITRSLGTNPNVDVDVQELEIEAGDRFLLCTDGVCGDLSDGDIADALVVGSPSEASWRLVDVALEKGGPDNATAVVVAIQGIEERRSKRGRFSGILGWR
jgi:PPM family protein phosphatase